MRKRRKMVEEEMRREREREKRYRDTLIVRAEWALERHSLTNTAVIHVFFLLSNAVFRCLNVRFKRKERL